MTPSPFVFLSSGHAPRLASRLRQRGLRALAALALASALVGCASRAPNLTLYVLRSAPPIEAQAAASLIKPAPSAAPWQLVLPVRLPAYLERSALLLPDGANGVSPSQSHRWAELLSSSVPRVLAQDLITLRGEGSVWHAPLPAGLVLKGQLRVEIVAFEVVPSGQAVMLSARWSTSESAASTPTPAAAAPRAHALSLTVPSRAADADSLIGAHRLALWQLAQAIAKTLD